MGDRLRCKVYWGGATWEGDILLETSELRVRGEAPLVLPFSEITRVEVVERETLVLTTRRGEARLSLGRHAARWAEKIRAPKSVLDKLGVASSHRVAAVGTFDDGLLEQLRARMASVESVEPGARCLPGAFDAIFYAVEGPGDLARLATLKRSLAPAGALWVVRRKGKGAPVSERDSMEAGKKAGLVDVKVVAFSSTHTAEKYVIPLKAR